MPYADVLLTIGGTVALGLLVPGPNLAVIAANAAVSRRAGFVAAFGAATGAMMLALAGSAGLVALLATEPGFAGLVQFVAGAALVGLGVRAVSQAAVLDLDPVAAERSGAPAAPFRTGLLTCLANPVTLTVYAGVFATLLPTSAPFWLRFAVVALTGLLSLAWYALIAATSSRLGSAARGLRCRQVAGLALGAALVVVGWRAVLRAIT
jgi:threonine efflux protein